MNPFDVVGVDIGGTFTDLVLSSEGHLAIHKLLSTPDNPAQAMLTGLNTITPGAPMNTPMSASHYPDELKQKWIDPALLTPAFVHLARLEASDTTGQRLDAWQLSNS